MKRIVWVVVIILVLSILKVYAIYYYIFSKMSYRFSGFMFTQEQEQTGNANILQSLDSLADRVQVDFTLVNPTRLNANVRRFNLKVLDGFGNEVGRIKTINQVLVPKRGEAIISVFVEDISTLKVTQDFIGGDLMDYEYVVSGWLGGIMPFRYKERIF
jgi:hypothetical protein